MVTTIERLVDDHRRTLTGISTTTDLASPASLSISMGDFRKLALRKALDLVRDVGDREDQRSSAFVKRTPTPLERYWTADELVVEARQAIHGIAGKHPGLDGFAHSCRVIVDRLATQQTALLLLDTYNELLTLQQVALPDRTDRGDDMFRITADARRIYLAVAGNYLGDRAPLLAAVDRHTSNVRFMASVCALMEDLRDKRRPPTKDESVAISVAYELITSGLSVPAAYQSLGVSGFREIQTYVSIADPGEGHMKVTSSDHSLLRGVVVHVEHIDRDEEFDLNLVEAYRLPAAINAAKVRLHVSSQAPVTAFIGRPVFESGNVKRDLLKSVHMTASACTAMFRNGIADCKIAVQRMTATEAITFLRAVVGNVMRDRDRQFLSAAFSINYPFVDDRPETIAQHGAPVTLTERMAIARLGVTVAKEGGFDKVAWDGASDEVPSVPILDQLALAEAVELAHLAHESGLECYVSAGCDASHLRPAAYAAIDGVGIGTSLHHIDPATKLMGALRPEAIRETLAVRDLAATEPFALCSRLLARLDRIFADGGLGDDENACRIALFEALRDDRLNDAIAVADRLASRQSVSMPDVDQPKIEEARRSFETGVDGRHASLDRWQSLVARVQNIVVDEPEHAGR